MTQWLRKILISFCIFVCAECNKLLWQIPAYLTPQKRRYTITAKLWAFKKSAHRKHNSSYETVVKNWVLLTSSDSTNWFVNWFTANNSQKNRVWNAPATTEKKDVKEEERFCRDLGGVMSKIRRRTPSFRVLEVSFDVSDLCYTQVWQVTRGRESQISEKQLLAASEKCENSVRRLTRQCPLQRRLVVVVAAGRRHAIKFCLKFFFVHVLNTATHDDNFSSPRRPRFSSWLRYFCSLPASTPEVTSHSANTWQSSAAAGYR